MADNDTSLCESEVEILGEMWVMIMEYGEEKVTKLLNTSICDIPGAPQLPREIRVRHLKRLLRYVPEIFPSSFYLKYHDSHQLRDGDVIVIHSELTWKTYAIVRSAKERKVICFANRDRCPVSDIRALFHGANIRLREVNLNKVLESNPGVIGVFRQKKQEDTLKTLERASTALAEKRRWSFSHFNSEHFVTQAVSGTRQCTQLKTLKSVTIKSLISGAVAGAVAPRLGGEVGKQVVKETVEEVGKQVAKEATEEVAGATAATATSRLGSGAKAGLIGGAIVEGACLVYTGITSGKKWKSGDMSGAEFRHHMVKRSVATGGSVAGGALGAAIGTAIIPVPFVGTFIGSVVGGVVGDLVGSKCGEGLDNQLFN